MSRQPANRNPGDDTAASSAQSFEFKINGEGVSPENVSLRDLLTVLGMMNAAISAIGGEEAEDELSLTRIDIGSLKCEITAKPEGFAAANRLTQAIASQGILKLPSKAKEKVRDIWKLTYQRGWESVSFSPNGSSLTPAEIRADQEVPDMVVFRGWTTLYGCCIRAGGSSRLSAQIRPIGEKGIITVRLASQNLAQELGHRLYETVGLEGVATWESKTGRLVVFKAEKLNDYSDRDVKSKARTIKQAFENLAEAAGDRWDNIDPDEYLQSLRDE